MLTPTKGVSPAYLNQVFERLIIDPHIPHRIQQSRPVWHPPPDLRNRFQGGDLLYLLPQILGQVNSELADRLNTRKKHANDRDFSLIAVQWRTEACSGSISRNNRSRSDLDEHINDIAFLRRFFVGENRRSALVVHSFSLVQDH